MRYCDPYRGIETTRPHGVWCSESGDDEFSFEQRFYEVPTLPSKPAERRSLITASDVDRIVSHALRDKLGRSCMEGTELIAYDGNGPCGRVASISIRRMGWGYSFRVDEESMTGIVGFPGGNINIEFGGETLDDCLEQVLGFIRAYRVRGHCRFDVLCAVKENRRVFYPKDVFPETLDYKCPYLLKRRLEGNLPIYVSRIVRGPFRMYDYRLWGQISKWLDGKCTERDVVEFANEFDSPTAA